MSAVTDRREAGRFELVEKGELVFADYRREADRLIIDHVEAPTSLRGTGAAGRLMEGILAHAGRENLHIVPLCSYAAAWLARRPTR
ncbi:MAG: GNAT family N-acetyltransferase [Caulobacteraceae bacterium]